MKKTLFIILALCSMSYGLSGYSLYKTYVAKDTVTHINLDSNFYRGVNWSNKLADTIDRNFIRWYDFNSHDSTLRYFKVDTIRSNPHVDSIAGNTVITGAPIVTGALTVDSLKSTKGINATGGTFSGALTGATLNTGNGANELYAMDQPVRTTDAVNFDSIVLSKGVKIGTGATGPTSTPYKIDLGNTFSNGETADKCKIYLYNDGSGYYGFGVGTNTDVQYHAKNVNGSHRFYVNDTIKMLLDRNGMHLDSIQLGTGSYLKNYVEGTFPCTLKTSDVTVQQVGTAYYTKIGNVLTVSIPKLIGTSNSNTLKLYCRFPYKAKLTDGITDDDARSVIVNNNGPAQGMVEVPEWEGYIPFSVGVSRTGFATSGPKGIYAPFTISYITE